MNNNITIRPFTWDDLPALADVINASVEANGEDQFSNAADLRARFEQPYFGPLENVLVAVEQGGSIVGCVSAEMDPRVGKGWGFGHVHPALPGAGDRDGAAAGCRRPAPGTGRDTGCAGTADRCDALLPRQYSGLR